MISGLPSVLRRANARRALGKTQAAGQREQAHQHVIRQQCIAVFKIVENTLCSSDGINRGKRGEVMHRGNVKRATVSEEDLKPLSC